MFSEAKKSETCYIAEPEDTFDITADRVPEGSESYPFFGGTQIRRNKAGEAVEVIEYPEWPSESDRRKAAGKSWEYLLEHRQMGDVFVASRGKHLAIAAGRVRRHLYLCP